MKETHCNRPARVYRIWKTIIGGDKPAPVEHEEMVVCSVCGRVLIGAEWRDAHEDLNRLDDRWRIKQN